MWYDQLNPIHSILNFYALSIMITNYTLTHPAMVELLANDNEHFDVIIVEVIFADALLGLGQHYNAPIIAFSTYPSWSVASLIGEPILMSYIPNLMLSHADNMSFGQRLDHAIVTIFEVASYALYPTNQAKIYNEVFRRTDKPTFAQVLNSVSMVLMNQIFLTSGPRPHMPNSIEVAGIHIEDTQPLAHDIQAFIDDAEHGVIYISFGSFIRSTNFPPDLMDTIVGTLGKLKQRVLWRWDEVDFAGKPSNVMAKTWFPQTDILAHPNVRLFVTSGGLLSVFEAAYFGLPIVGIPFFGDQPFNIDLAVGQGSAVLIEYTNVSEASLTWALGEVLHESRYSVAAKNISIRYRDRPIRPIALAQFWVEYVARHRGAPHLRPAGQNLSFLRYYGLDVYGMLVAATVLWLYLVWIATTTLCSKGRKLALAPTIWAHTMLLDAFGNNIKSKRK